MANKFTPTQTLAVKGSFWLTEPPSAKSRGHQVLPSEFQGHCLQLPQPFILLRRFVLSFAAQMGAEAPALRAAQQRVWRKRETPDPQTKSRAQDAGHIPPPDSSCPRAGGGLDRSRQLPPDCPLVLTWKSPCSLGSRGTCSLKAGECQAGPLSSLLCLLTGVPSH